MSLVLGVNLVWWGLQADLENQECLVKLEDRDHLVLLECLEQRVQMVLEVHLEAGDPLVLRECQEWRE